MGSGCILIRCTNHLTRLLFNRNEKQFFSEFPPGEMNMNSFILRLWTVTFSSSDEGGLRAPNSIFWEFEATQNKKSTHGSHSCTSHFLNSCKSFSKQSSACEHQANTGQVYFLFQSMIVWLFVSWTVSLNRQPAMPPASSSDIITSDKSQKQAVKSLFITKNIGLHI